MNRLALATDNTFATKSPAGIENLCESRSLDFVEAVRDGDAPHATFAPMNYEANYA
jgi:hypothetical protein